jgi:hypothetical protein
MNAIELLSLSIQGVHVRFYVPPEYRAHLVPLPWQCPMENWDRQGVQFIPVKSGLSRHVVRFIASEQRRFAIKETTRESAHRELANYVRLVQRSIPT